MKHLREFIARYVQVTCQRKQFGGYVIRINFINKVERTYMDAAERYFKEKV